MWVITRGSFLKKRRDPQFQGNNFSHATTEHRTFEERPAEEGRDPRKLREERKQWIDHLGFRMTQLKFALNNGSAEGKTYGNP